MKYLNDHDFCQKISAMCRDPNKRLVGAWENGHPSKWHPHTVHNPSTGACFSDNEAWEHIADAIDAHHALKIVELRKPPGLVAYEILLPSKHQQSDDLYIKFSVSKNGNTVIGRSFHYSTKLTSY